MRLEDADVMRDDIRWDCECDECHAVARWVGTVKVRGLRILDDGSLGWATVRVCRICASRALLLPERRPFADASEMNDPYIRPVEPDPHDLEDDDDDAPEPQPPTAPRAAETAADEGARLCVRRPQITPSRVHACRAHAPDMPRTHVPGRRPAARSPSPIGGVRPAARTIEFAAAAGPGGRPRWRPSARQVGRHEWLGRPSLLPISGDHVLSWFWRRARLWLSDVRALH
jgi:hypothetical protein